MKQFEIDEILSIKQIALYCNCTNANIGYHINSGHLDLWKDHPKLVKYEGDNKIWIDHIKLKKDKKESVIRDAKSTIKEIKKELQAKKKVKV